MPSYLRGAPSPHGVAGLILATLLAGCASTGPAPVEDRSLGGPPPRREPAPPVPSVADTYRVQRGDTLYGIARRFDTTVDAIKRLNRLRSNTINIGDRLTVR